MSASEVGQNLVPLLRGRGMFSGERGRVSWADSGLPPPPNSATFLLRQFDEVAPLMWGRKKLTAK